MDRVSVSEAESWRFESSRARHFNFMSIDSDRHFMTQALLQARKALEAGEIPVGAVVVKDGKILAQGRNRREQKNDFLAHAEIEALKAAQKKLGNWRLSECCLYVTLEPCPMCAGAILQTRIKEVIFGAYDEKYGSAGSAVNLLDYPGLSLSCLFRGGILREDCEQLLTVFFKDLRTKE